MKLSYTALKTFRDCHFRFHLRYDRGLPGRPRPAAQSSRALHGALHLFHQGLKGQREDTAALFLPAAVSLDTLLAHFKGYYDNPTRPLTESQYQEGRALLTRYWETHRGQFPTPYLLEEPFKLHVGPFLLTGRFDRLDETPEGYEIVDYKLSHRSLAPPDPLQLDVYQLGFHAKTGQEAKKLSFCYLRLGGGRRRARRLMISPRLRRECGRSAATSAVSGSFVPTKARAAAPVTSRSFAQQRPGIPGWCQ